MEGKGPPSQGCHLVGRLEVSADPPRIYDFSFLLVNLTCETLLYTAAKTIRYADSDPPRNTETPHPTIY